MRTTERKRIRLNEPAEGEPAAASGAEREAALDPKAGADAAAGPDPEAGPDVDAGPDVGAGAEPDPDPGDATDEPGRPWWRRLRLPGVLRRNPPRWVAVAVIGSLLLTGGGFAYAAAQLKDPGATRNRALTDAGATSRLTGDVSDSLSRIFAYSPGDTQSTEQAARDTLEGTAAAQYQKLFAQIRQQVATQQLTLSTRVVRAGVVSLTGDRAQLLVFLDQTAQRAGAAPTTAAAQLSVAAHLVGGHWRISNLTAR